MTTVRACPIIHAPPDRSLRTGLGVEVAAGADGAEVEAVGLRLGTGGDVVVLEGQPDASQPRLPLRLDAYESTRWLVVVRPPGEVLGRRATGDRIEAFADVGGRRVTVATSGEAHPAGEPAGSPSVLHHLHEHERRDRSQNGEDGVLEAILGTVGVDTRFAVEFGCGDGVQCNTARLAAQGWRGLHMDGFHESRNPDIQVRQEFVSAANIAGLLDAYAVPEPFDLLSIDIDGNDFWVWRAIDRRPRVVVIEYNGHVSPRLARTIRYDEDFRWNGSDYFGASLAALARLATGKGYTLVHCEGTGTNAFFVRDDLLPAGFAARPIHEVHRRPNYLGLGLAYLGEPVLRMVDPFPSGGPET